MDDGLHFPLNILVARLSTICEWKVEEINTVEHSSFDHKVRYPNFDHFYYHLYKIGPNRATYLGKGLKESLKGLLEHAKGFDN